MIDLIAYAITLVIIAAVRVKQEEKIKKKSFKDGFRQGVVEGSCATTNILKESEKITEDEKDQLDFEFRNHFMKERKE